MDRAVSVIDVDAFAGAMGASCRRPQEPAGALAPLGAWEVVAIIDGLLRNDSDVQPDTIHADRPHRRNSSRCRASATGTT
jgi:hypothetical protein